MYLRKSTAALENILIYNNQARNGAAIYTSQSSCSLKNLTITGNMADELGGAILLSGGNRVTVKNTIFWNNYAPSGSTIAFKKTSGDDTLDFSYSDIDTVKSDWLYHGEYSSEKKLFNWNEGSICKDPLFADEDRSDFTLQKCSPCIDSGDPLADCSMEPQPNGGRINMGAFGGTSLAAVTSLETLLEQPVPEIFSLSQNYPNPFNPLTTINYELPSTNYVDLSIYNLLGQKIATLVNQKQPAGRYQIQWNARGFASGVYYYRLIAGSLVETKKLVLLR